MTIVPIALVVLAAPSLAGDQRLYRLPEDVNAFHAANQEIPEEDRQWLIVEVPRFDAEGNAVEVVACTAQFQAEYPKVSGSAPYWCNEDPSYEGDPACEPPFDRGPTQLEERIEDPTDQVAILLHGLGGRVDVDVACESTGGVGPPATLDLDLGGSGPPTHPVVTLCSHNVMHAGQTVCQPQE